MKNTNGQEMFELVKRLFPICRSITGEGVRETLRVLSGVVPEMKVMEIPSGTQCFDWTIPDEWNIRDAYIEDESGHRVIDFRKNNLHVVGYSVPVRTELSLEDLESHLHSLPEQPEAIPYVTSYYKPYWGFCLSHNLRTQLKKGKYRVVIDSTLKPGSLTFAEVLISGKTRDEIFLSSYVCHPSMANNELSGPVVTAYLAKWLLEKTNHYTYRIVLVPETIGAIAYLSRNFEDMKSHVRAGFQITCVGDDRTFSFVPSRRGNTLSDRVARHVLQYEVGEYKSYSFLNRGSDERQYCSPRVDLPVASICRSKYGTYPEYHTSLDDLSVVSPAGFEGSLQVYQKCLNVLENNFRYRLTTYGEPQLGKRGLRPTLGSQKHYVADVMTISNFLAYCDGELDLIDIAEQINKPALELLPWVGKFLELGLIEKV